jgi:hypothetical protein
LLAGFSVSFAALSLSWIRALLAGKRTTRATVLARSSFGLYGIGAIIFALMFSTSGRYIDIPLPQFFLPLCVALMLLVLGRQNVTRPSLDYAVFTRCQFFNRHALLLLSFAALACIWGEAGAMLGGSDFISMHPTLGERIPLIARSILANHELLLWCLACVLLALPFRTVKPLE